RYYAPVFHQKDVVLLAVYSHMIDSFLYLPVYSIGHLIAAQIEEQMKKAGAIGPEFERIAKMGDDTPDLWMENARGKATGPDVLDFPGAADRECWRRNRVSDLFAAAARRTACRDVVEQQSSREPVHHSFEHGKEAMQRIARSVNHRQSQHGSG